jgi:hypothetical protein
VQPWLTNRDLDYLDLRPVNRRTPRKGKRSKEPESYAAENVEHGVRLLSERCLRTAGVYHEDFVRVKYGGTSAAVPWPSPFGALENLVIALVQFVVGKVGIPLRYLYVGMACKLLRQFQVAAAA